MSYVTHPDILISIRWLMALVFMTAAVGKMRHWSEFSGVLANYRLLPTLLVKPRPPSASRCSPPAARSCRY
jgi:uncharacterized membrane protein YphA (DoxX/SURF4 family)